MRSRIPLITGLIASLALAGAQQAQAADSGDVAIGVAAGALIGGVLASQRPVRVYEPAPVYHAPPPVVYYEPRPVYYEARPVYYSPAPVIVVKPYGHKHWRKHHRHYHRYHYDD
ncbi:hypothetical protein AAFN46_12480 [Pseudomonas sp. CAU 1711]|uniref:hypothetical protein n=1 Tax=Pseudomonas sp. CAU 1711 TaxID=3140356 RepID=UPI003261CFD4